MKLIRSICATNCGLIAWLAIGSTLSFPLTIRAQASLNSKSAQSSSTNSSTGKTGAKPSEVDDESIIRVPKEEDAPPPKEFTAAETRKTCAKYTGKLLSVYGEIYQLQNCMRHLIQAQEEVFRLTRRGVKIVEVEATDVAALPIGEPWENVTAKTRPCATFNRKYVTFSYTDIYYVENCVRRLIPDYETFLSHRKTHGGKTTEILALTEKEFWSLRQGRDISSIIDEEFRKLLEGSAGVDVIPIDEACKGVEGKVVTFYSRMYKIEKCRKREIDAEAFTMHHKVGDRRLVELRAEQWLSMPDGTPYSDGTLLKQKKKASGKSE